jgi:ferrous iron transport protein B
MKIALVGQPNSGKSTLFNSVAGYKSMTANFPGVTARYARSRVYLNGTVAELIDLPGTYSLTTSSPAEAAAREFLHTEDIDVVINVIDTSVMCRSLELTLQLIDLGLPLLVCLNMIDEAHRKGICVDIARLSLILGVPVVTTIAAEGVGVYELFQEVRQLKKDLPNSHRDRGIPFQRDTEEIVGSLAEKLRANGSDPGRIPPRLLALKLLEGEDYYLNHVSKEDRSMVEEARQKLADSRGKPADEVIHSERHALSMKAFELVATVTQPPVDFRERLDAALTHKVWGYVILFSLLVGFFGLVYGVGALIEPPILQLFEKSIAHLGEHFSQPGFVFYSLRGVLQGLSGGMAIVLPYLLPFLIGMAILEDVGYLPRVAFLMDAFMHRIGLHGTAIVPAILGYGCNVPAVMATRILQSRRDRFIAAVIATLTPCSARMTVIFGLVAFYAGPMWAVAIYGFNIVVIAFSGKLLSMLMPEKTPGMILEVPAYHLPRLRIVLLKTWFRLREFIVIAWPLLIVGSLFLSLAEYRGWSAEVNAFLRPLTGLLGLPEPVGTTLIFGVLRKELTMLMLYQALGTTQVLLVMTVPQIIVFTLFVTFYIPCLATIAALTKEIGGKLMLLVVLYTLVSATLIGLLARLVFALGTAL